MQDNNIPAEVLEAIKAKANAEYPQKDWGGGIIPDNTLQNAKRDGYIEGLKEAYLKAGEAYSLGYYNGSKGIVSANHLINLFTK